MKAPIVLVVTVVAVLAVLSAPAAYQTLRDGATDFLSTAAEAALVDTLPFWENLTFATNGTHDHYHVTLSHTIGYINLSHDTTSDTFITIETRNIEHLAVDMEALYNDERATAFASPGATANYLWNWIISTGAFSATMNTDCLETVTFTNLGAAPSRVTWNGYELRFSFSGSTISVSVPDNGIDILEVFFEKGWSRATPQKSVTVPPGQRWVTAAFPIVHDWTATDIINQTGADAVAVLRNGKYQTVDGSKPDKYDMNFHISSSEAVLLYGPELTTIGGDSLTVSKVEHDGDWHGFAYIGPDTTASDFSEAKGLDAVATLSGTEYTVYMAGKPGNDFALETGQGLFFHAGEPGTLEVTA